MLSKSQMHLASYFENASKSDALKQCYIISGDRGLGKSYLVSEIKKYILCDTKSACGVCPSCLSISKDAHPDCVCISNEDKKIIEVNKIRELSKMAYIKPIMGDIKLFIIENAHLMEQHSQNALLKLIEEPPLCGVFILVCDNLNSIYPTILSRCAKLELSPWSDEDLKAIANLPEQEEYMYRYALGNLGKLMDISVDEEFKSLRSEITDGFASMISGSDDVIYDYIKLLENNKENKDKILNILPMFLRDVMFYKTNNTELITNNDKLKEIKAVSDILNYKQSFNILKLVCDAPQKLGKYGNFGMFIHTLMIQLKEEING